jgi:GNAT superfamily N-acetyltransferase
MSPGLRIEPTTDAAVIARLNGAIQEHHRRLYPGTFKPHAEQEVQAFLAGRLQDPAWRCLLAFHDGQEAGYALFFLWEYQENPFRLAYRGVQIDQISVLPAFKRKGIGKALMAEVEAFARREGVSQLELTFWEGNEEARTFYEELGFEPCIRFVTKHLE